MKCEAFYCKDPNVTLNDYYNTEFVWDDPDRRVNIGDFLRCLLPLSFNNGSVAFSITIEYICSICKQINDFSYPCQAGMAGMDTLWFRDQAPVTIEVECLTTGKFKYPDYVCSSGKVSIQVKF